MHVPQSERKARNPDCRIAFLNICVLYFICCCAIRCARRGPTHLPLTPSDLLGLGTWACCLDCKASARPTERSTPDFDPPLCRAWRSLLMNSSFPLKLNRPLK